MFWKILSTRSGHFGNFGNFGNRKVRGENFGNFGIEFGRADRHPSDDRPCTTTQLRGHGLSTGGGATIYIYIGAAFARQHGEPELGSGRVALHGAGLQEASNSLRIQGSLGFLEA